MPQVVDLEALVCGGGDGKIVCETTLLAPAGGPKTGDNPHPPPPAPDEPDLPAESFRLAVEEETEWVDRNAAAFYDRHDSTKEITNPKSHQHQTGANPAPKLQSNSQRYSAKPKAPIIGLPNTLQHSGYLGRSARRPAANVRIFPKQARQRGKSAVPESEPTSPKVSCIGRVLSDRDRNRRRKANRKGASDVSLESSSVYVSSPGRRRRGGSGSWAAIFGFSCCVQGREPAVLDEEELQSSRTSAATTKTKVTPSAGDTTAAMPAPGLGGMKRFASGRRPASWAGDMEQDVEHVTRSGPLPAKQEQGSGILGRRSVGSLEDLDCDRDWKSAGPSSV